MILWMCHCCTGDPCEFRAPDDRTPPDQCRIMDPRWREVPSGRSIVAAPDTALVPGPFCEIPACAIVRATAEGGRYTIEIGGVDRLEIPVSRAAFHDAVRAMGDVDGLR